MSTDFFHKIIMSETGNSSPDKSAANKNMVITWNMNNLSVCPYAVAQPICMGMFPAKTASLPTMLGLLAYAVEHLYCEAMLSIMHIIYSSAILCLFFKIFHVSVFCMSCLCQHAYVSG